MASPRSGPDNDMDISSRVGGEVVCQKDLVCEHYEVQANPGPEESERRSSSSSQLFCNVIYTRALGRLSLRNRYACHA